METAVQEGMRPRGWVNHWGNFFRVHVRHGERFPMPRSFYFEKDSVLYTGSQAFLTKITATPAAYGLLPADATDYAVFANDFKTKYLLAIDPPTRTQPSITAKNDARTLLRAATAQVARKIYATPTVTDQQKQDLGLSVRKTPEPSPAPGTVSDFKVQLTNSGALSTKWKNSGAAGCVYNIYRRLGSTGPMIFLGGVGEKKYTDYAVPAGTATVQYQIQAVRPTGLSESVLFTVSLGMETGAPSVAQGTPVKLAA